jgi:ubiquinone/menaquinone biosynthesis C-methylase UbiE
MSRSIATALLPSLEPRAEVEYRAFPNEGRRNFMQETLEVPALIRVLALPTGGRVLEVGCGRGIALPVLARKLERSHLVGIDIDAELLADAGARLIETRVVAELRRADVRALPFPDRSFDLVIDFGTCYHIARADRALSEIARVLVPGGLFVEETPVSQLLSHPVRAFGRRLPWDRAHGLPPGRWGLLWSTRVRC